jgi:hypothetical protein
MAQFIIDIALFIILATVVILSVIPRKARARGSNQSPSPEMRKKVQPDFCYHDCVRVHGPQKGRFCDVACGLSENRQ